MAELNKIQSKHIAKKKTPSKQLRDFIKATKFREKRHMRKIPDEVYVEKSLKLFEHLKNKDNEKVTEFSYWGESNGPTFSLKVTLVAPYNFQRPKRHIDIDDRKIPNIETKVKRKLESLKTRIAPMTESFVRHILTEPKNPIPDILCPDFLTKKGIDLNKQIQIQENISQYKRDILNKVLNKETNVDKVRYCEPHLEGKAKKKQVKELTKTKSVQLSKPVTMKKKLINKEMVPVRIYPVHKIASGKKKVTDKNSDSSVPSPIEIDISKSPIPSTSNATITTDLNEDKEKAMKERHALPIVTDLITRTENMQINDDDFDSFLDSLFDS